MTLVSTEWLADHLFDPGLAIVDMRWREDGSGRALEDGLAGRGLTLGHFPQSIDISTLGGWIAARSAGQKSARYGRLEDLILGLEVVLPGA